MSGKRLSRRTLACLYWTASAQVHSVLAPETKGLNLRDYIHESFVPRRRKLNRYLPLHTVHFARRGEPIHTMYITSELFVSDAASHDRCDSPTSTPTHNWSTMAVESQYPAGLGKRKRQLDTQEGSSSRYDRASGFVADIGTDVDKIRIHAHHSSPASNRGSVRFHSPTHGTHSLGNRAHRYSPSSQGYTRSEGRPVKQLKRLNPKVSLVKMPSHLMDLDLDLGFPANTNTTTPAATPTPTDTDLRACHICHSAPKRKKDLENYLQCQTCEQRACYICARECSGGCQKRLCSKCCVEDREEGDAWCLMCYERKFNAS